jgi:hypothetical protein
VDKFVLAANGETVKTSLFFKQKKGYTEESKDYIAKAHVASRPLIDCCSFIET